MLTKKEIRTIAQEAFLVQGNIEDAMVLVEDYGFDEDDVDAIREYMEDYEEKLLAIYENS